MAPLVLAPFSETERGSLHSNRARTNPLHASSSQFAAPICFRTIVPPRSTMKVVGRSRGLNTTGGSPLHTYKGRRIRLLSLKYRTVFSSSLMIIMRTTCLFRESWSHCRLVISATQGPHQVAQKFSKTTSPRSLESANSFPPKSKRTNHSLLSRKRFFAPELQMRGPGNLDAPLAIPLRDIPVIKTSTTDTLLTKIRTPEEREVYNLRFF